LRFNQLPEEEIHKFLLKIVTSEKLSLNEDTLKRIQQLHNSDIRSMINFIQSNQNVKANSLCVISNNVWEDFYKLFQTSTHVDALIARVQYISVEYNIDKKNIIKDFINYIIRNKLTMVNADFLRFTENLMHTQDCKTSNYIYYSLLRLISFIPK